MNRKIPRLAIVLPCYNEQSILPQTFRTLFPVLQNLIEKNQIAEDSFLYCVDDGSQDQTWQIIQHAHQENPTAVKGMRLSKNAGQQNALFSGLMHVKEKVDCAISMDADLQDSVAAIAVMVEHFKQGSEIVYGVRQVRKNDSFFKKNAALLFYKLIKQWNKNIIVNHADFRLLSQHALMHLNQFEERNLFLRGLIPLMGFQSSQVAYDRAPRLLGESKYTIKKMLSLAWDGITSFSHFPLRFILLMGLFSFFISVSLIMWASIEKCLSHTVPGWSFVMIPMCFMGGVQLLSIGILGEYIAKIYLEVKRRPRYIVERECNDDSRV